MRETKGVFEAFFLRW